MKETDKKLIEDMPKVVLHLHLDGSLRPETVQEWLKEETPDISLEEVTNMLSVGNECKSLNQYLEKFDLPMQVLQTEENIERATYELFEDLAKQNVIYAEVRFAPSKHREDGLSYEQIVEAAIRGMEKAKEKCNIGGNLILCCMRGDDNKQENFQTIYACKKYLGKGICAADLAGAEALFKTENFEDVFNIASELEVPFTIHAGEADGPESIKKAIEFGAKRIGHGVRCIEDDKLVEQLRQQEIPLEVCPISNEQTKAVERTPIEELYKKGVKTTLSTDNNTVSNTNILKEYEYILNNTKLGINDLIRMNINAARGAFTDLREKTSLVNKVSNFEKFYLEGILENNKVK